MASKTPKKSTYVFRSDFLRSPPLSGISKWATPVLSVIREAKEPTEIVNAAESLVRIAQQASKSGFPISRTGTPQAAEVDLKLFARALWILETRLENYFKSQGKKGYFKWKQKLEQAEKFFEWKLIPIRRRGAPSKRKIRVPRSYIRRK